MITPNFLVICDGNHGANTFCGHCDCWLGSESKQPEITITRGDGRSFKWSVTFGVSKWPTDPPERTISFGDFSYGLKHLLRDYPLKERVCIYVAGHGAPEYEKDNLYVAAEDVNHVLEAVLRVSPLARAPRGESLDNACLDLACAALKPLAAIWEAYLANALDDEARRFWGNDDEHENQTPPGEIELVSGRGGEQLLTLLHAKAAWHALKAYEQP